MDHHHSYIVPPCEEALREVYRDEHLVAVEKPPFLLSIPGRRKENTDSVLSRVLADYPSAKLLHRLDLDTSGVMLFALSDAVQKSISRMFQQRRIEKTYEAIVYGRVSSKYASIDLPIAPDWRNRPRQKIDWRQGKAARTSFECLEYLSLEYLSIGALETSVSGSDGNHAEPLCTRLLLKPYSGRSHQLRIHLASIGHPILGCDLYGHEAAYAATPRLMLHATGLSLPHPVSAEPLTLRSQAPF